MDNSFLPTGYTAPKASGNYFKLEKGENRFRILSSAIIGYEYWTVDKKPVRSRTPFNGTPQDAKLEDVKDQQGNVIRREFRPKHFWAFVVWNYAESKIQVMEITQTTIMSAIEALVKNPKWGKPQGYDIVVTATGDGFDREYSTVPEPHTDAPTADISNIYLEQLFDGGDPFNATTSDGSPMPNFDRGEIVPEDFPPQDAVPTIS